jgi:predicted RNA-binding protein with PIN domain
MNDYLIVDGYNIIYAWPALQKLKDASLGHARSRLVDILASYAALSGERIIVVFDAHLVKNNQEHSEAVSGVEIIFTQEGETADAVIERLVGNLPDRAAVFVATSDWDEQRIIFGRGAYRVTPGELLARIKKLNKEGEQRCQTTAPADSYLENRLVDDVRKALENLRRGKG